MVIPEGSIPPIETSTLTTQPAASTPAEVIQQQTSVQDYVILRYSVIGLIMIALVAIIGSLFLIQQNKGMQDGITAIIALGGVAVGGLSTLLVRTPLPQTPPSVKVIPDRRTTNA